MHTIQSILVFFGGSSFLSCPFSAGKLLLGLLLRAIAPNISLTDETLLPTVRFTFSYLRLSWLLSELALRWVEFKVGTNILLKVSSLFYSYSWQAFTYLAISWYSCSIFVSLFLSNCIYSISSTRLGLFSTHCLTSFMLCSYKRCSIYRFSSMPVLKYTYARSIFDTYQWFSANFRNTLRPFAQKLVPFTSIAP